MRYRDAVKQYGFTEITVAEHVQRKVTIPRRLKKNRYIVEASRFETRDGNYDIHIYRTPYLNENEADEIYSVFVNDWNRTGPRTWNSISKLFVDSEGIVRNVS